MRVLFATNHAYPPDRVGGSELSTHDLCLTLQERGIQVGVMSASRPRVFLASRRRLARLLRAKSDFARDDRFGYPVFRCKQPVEAVRAVIDAFGPSVTVLQAGRPLALLDRFAALDEPCAVYLRDAFFDDLGGAVVERRGVRYVATSHDLALRFAAAFGIHPLRIPPLVRPDRYRVESSGTHVTFVCPFPGKGLNVALGLAARRRDIPFLFLESWPVHRRDRVILHARKARTPNISYRRPTDDMRTVYRDTKLLLVPSRWPEAWGRVVSEAQLSGIPVLASLTGGLPEAVGPGGVLIDPAADLDHWERALAQIWDDSFEYERLAELARRHAGRPEFQPEAIIEQLLAVLGELAAARTDAPLRGRAAS
jgi:glycosyltransferase involved in cell wall biosynthesis